jgi:hypothetical protein
MVLVAAAVAYVAWTFVSPIDMPFQRADRSMHMTAQVNGRSLRVTGTTDLPDGALVDWYLSRGLVDDNELPSGHIAVRSSSFSFGADLSGWPSGTATAEVSFSCDWGTVQPRQVTDLVGEHCEHLSGAQVYVDSPGDPKQLFVPVDFTVP